MLYHPRCTLTLKDNLVQPEFFCPFCPSPSTSLIPPFSTCDLKTKYITKYKIRSDNSFSCSVSFILPSLSPSSLLSFILHWEKKKKKSPDCCLRNCSCFCVLFFTAEHGHSFYCLAVQDLKNVKAALCSPDSPLTPAVPQTNWLGKAQAQKCTQLSASPNSPV